MTRILATPALTAGMATVVAAQDAPMADEFTIGERNTVERLVPEITVAAMTDNQIIRVKALIAAGDSDATRRALEAIAAEQG